MTTTTTEKPQRLAFKPREVAAMLAVSERTVTRMLEVGRIRGFRVGGYGKGCWRISSSEVNRLLGEFKTAG